jgi:hypothetical protein
MDLDPLTPDAPLDDQDDSRLDEYFELVDGPAGIEAAGAAKVRGLREDAAARRLMNDKTFRADMTAASREPGEPFDFDQL